MKKYLNPPFDAARTGFFLLLTGLSLSLFVSCTTRQNLPSGGGVELSDRASSLLSSQTLRTLALTDSDGGVAMALRMEEGQPDVLHIHVEQVSKRPWDVECVLKNVEAVRKGEALMALCRLKAAPPLNPSADVRATLLVYAGVPWKPIATTEVLADTEARTFYLPFVAPTNYAPNELVISLQFGSQTQHLKLEAVDLLRVDKEAGADLPASPIMYSGRSAEAAWREVASERILAHRNGRLITRVLDADGQPVKEAEVFMYLDNPTFRFGASVSKQFVAVGGNKTKRKYSDTISKTFNSITLEHGTRWGQWAQGEDSPLRAETMDALQWAQHKGLRVRGGTLIYPSWKRQNPPGLDTLSPARLGEKILSHIEGISSALSPYVDSWDVISDARIANDFEKAQGLNAPISWFKQAAKQNPDTKLFYSEFALLSGPEDELDAVLTRIDILKRKGAPIHGLGLSCHFSRYLPDPAEVIKRLDKIAARGLKVEITEFDVAIDDVDARADFVRDFLTVIYSHPTVEGITFWSVWAGHSWKPNAALWDAEWNVTSQGEQVVKLLQDTWSAQKVGRPDEKGEFSLNGPFGKYNIVVHVGGREVRRSVTLDAAHVEIDLSLRDLAPEPKKRVVRPVVVQKPKATKLDQRIATVEALSSKTSITPSTPEKADLPVETKEPVVTIEEKMPVAETTALETDAPPVEADVEIAEEPAVEELPEAVVETMPVKATEKPPEETVQEAIEKQMEKILPSEEKSSADQELIDELGFDPFAPVRRR